MQPPKLSLLCSRLSASIATTSLLLAVSLSSVPQHFARAAELPLLPEDLQRSPPDHPVLPASPGKTVLEYLGEEAEVEGDGSYVPDFTYFDRSLVGRQAPELDRLNINEKRNIPIEPGRVLNFIIEKSQIRAKRAATVSPEVPEREGADKELEGDDLEVTEQEDDDNEGDSNELRKRQDVKRVWISANTCIQPNPTTNLVTSDSPQLTMYVSTSTDNQKPGPDATQNLATEPIDFRGGYAEFDVRAESDIYIGISAPALSQGWNGSWNFEVAASTDGSFHGYEPTSPFLYMIDTDSESALFVTFNLTESSATEDVDAWKEKLSSLQMYAFPQGSWNPMVGLERSYCGLTSQFKNNNNATENITVAATITTKFGFDYPKGQFHVQGLENGKTYNGFLVMNGSAEGGLQGAQIPLGGGTLRNGGRVFQQFNWTTKADDSCQVLVDLDFCSDVAYAVPSSLDFKFDDDKLKKIYDDQAREYYNNFTKSLAQVACDTTSTAQYSLARTCEDCRRDYKAWLCSVLIPRCEDWTANDPWLQDRNINMPFANGSLPYASNLTAEFNETMRDRFAFSRSRNPIIDTEIKPGPYKELLPCDNLCFDIVRSCPAQLGFSCPNSPARELSYGRRDPDQPDILKCNFPGAVVKLNVDRGAASSLEMLSVRNVVLVAWLVGFIEMWM